MVKQYILLIVETSDLSLLEETLEEYVYSVLVNGVSGYEKFNDDILTLSFSRWSLRIILYDTDILEEIKNFIITICNSLQIKIIDIQQLQDNINYLLQKEDNISIQISSFTIYNDVSAYNDNITNTSSIPLLIRNSTAFGTGRHESTAMCLEFISDIKNQNVLNEPCMQVLDLGTGSGVLAIATAKLFSQARITATDIDALAIDTANDFFILNGVQEQIKSLESTGFNKIPKEQKFNLIIANILLNPLLHMTEDFYQYLDSLGCLILGGFLDTQHEQLKTSLVRRGLQFVAEKSQNNWKSLLFIKS